MVTWYFQGVSRTNYSLTVNTGSALVLGCLARAKNNKVLTLLNSPAFVITKGSAPTFTVTAATAAATTVPDDTTITNAGVPFALAVTGGTLLWDSVNGNAAGYDYILAFASLPMITALSPSQGYLQMYIPSLVASDAGLYYCTYYDGSTAAVTATNTANSGWLSLTITTKSGSGSSRSAQRNKAFEYSIALLGASKMLF